jgi:phage baseplate assembly protein W
MASSEITTYGITPDNQIKLDLTSRSKKSYGFSFPLGRKKGKGDYNKESGISLLKNNLEQLILTEKGERVMIPQYGMSLRRFLFQPLTEELFTNIRQEVLTSIATFMPEVSVNRIQVLESEDINIEGGMGLLINLVLVATELNNTIFTVGVKIA